MIKKLFAVCMAISALQVTRKNCFAGDKNSSRLWFNYSRQYYVDHNSVRYDNVAPNGHIDMRNTNSYCLQLQYDQPIKGSFFLRPELMFGRRRYEIMVLQNMTGFDPNATDYLKDYNWSYGTSHHKPNYWGVGLSVGYKKSIDQKWTLSGTIGVIEKLFFYGNPSYYANDFNYLDNNKDRQSVNASAVEYKFGRPENPRRPFYFPNTIAIWQWYIGVERGLNSRFVKGISLGIEGARSIAGWNREESAIFYSSPNINQLLASRDVFIDRNISFGLRLGVGFWQ